MKKFAFALLAMATALAITPSAKATTVDYSTVGGFSASGGADTATFGGGANTLILTFAGLSPSSVNAPSNASAGFIIVSVTGTGATASGNFTLTIDQTVPGVGSGGFSGVLNGAISANSSGGTLDFTSTTLVLDGVSYTLQQPPGGYDLVPPSTLNGETSIQMAIATPEPSSLLLLGTGLLGLALVAFRKTKATRPVMHLNM